MLRLSFSKSPLVKWGVVSFFATTLSIGATAQSNEPASAQAAPAGDLQETLQESQAQYTELEQQIIDASGLLSLSQQVKYTAQRLINQSSQQAETGGAINHAQHFAIAKSLANRWTEEVWQQRLLAVIDGYPERVQQVILSQLQQPALRASQRKEKAAIGVQHSAEYQRYMNKLRQQPPAASRWTLVENIDKASGFSQMIIQVREAVIAEIGSQVKAWKAPISWQNDARREVVEFLFYAYRTTSNPELQQVIRGFQQPELSQFYTDVGREITRR